MLIIRRSNCINTESGVVFSVSDRPVCRLRRNWFCSVCQPGASDIFCPHYFLYFPEHYRDQDTSVSVVTRARDWTTGY